MAAVAAPDGREWRQHSFIHSCMQPTPIKWSSQLAGGRMYTNIIVPRDEMQVPHTLSAHLFRNLRGSKFIHKIYTHTNRTQNCGQMPRWKKNTEREREGDFNTHAHDQFIRRVWVFLSVLLVNSLSFIDRNITIYAFCENIYIIICNRIPRSCVWKLLEWTTTTLQKHWFTLTARTGREPCVRRNCFGCRRIHLSWMIHSEYNKLIP